ncbi:MAG: hypothetical protein JRJ12_13765 [Deltaproteobacteria bacterium]|nr:hypothetical protein [Deltaproteobacteria bacterium]MBW2072495.1 hypothetical protein [Deltaproteobacteria bacterium]
MEGLIRYLSRRYQRVAEVGLGNYTRVARTLSSLGLQVTATDIAPRAVDFPVQFDDVYRPRLSLYLGVQCLYSIRPPPELLPPLTRLAEILGVDLLVKPLAAEPPDGTLINMDGSFFYLFPASTRQRKGQALCSKAL